MQLFSTAPSFDDPIGLLMACHNRILGHCETLERLPGHLSAHGSDDEVRQAIRRILRYFHTAARLHHADEEENLFPLLLAHVDFPFHLRAPLRDLALQHRELEAAWEDLAKDLEDVSMGHRRTLSPERFISMHRAHIALENDEIFPIAARLLSVGILDEIGSAMRMRRSGVKP
jgi:Uncharacterized conserved protein